jgi:hypothetical protein
MNVGILIGLLLASALVYALNMRAINLSREMTDRGFLVTGIENIATGLIRVFSLFVFFGSFGGLLGIYLSS